MTVPEGYARHTGSMPLRHPARTLLGAALVIAAAAGCSSSDGRTLPPPEPRQTTTPVSSPIVGLPTDEEGDGDGEEVFALFSDAFTEGEPIPARHGCDGEDLSPPLDWASTPATAVELGIVVRDLDAAGYVHWVMAGIDPLITAIGEDGVPETAVEGPNDAGRLGWSGPCPPAGSRHTYSFAVHALAAPVALPPGATAQEAALAIEEASTAQAILTGTFER